MRPPGISAFVRCKNEQEYIVASLMSVYRVFDEIVVILNNSTDLTRELVTDLMTDHPKIRMMEYSQECAQVGPGYLERVNSNPSRSLARYYNWCLTQTTFSHVCKWDGDMIALPTIEPILQTVANSDVVFFDGYDVLGKYTTELEPRIFRYVPDRSYYEDWDLYEVLKYDYTNVSIFDSKCYLHLKLVKNDWLRKSYVDINSFAARTFPPPNEKAQGLSTNVNTIARFLRIPSRLKGALKNALQSRG
jgi:glycosyltransferase involved in cell wall biosynthesis